LDRLSVLRFLLVQPLDLQLLLQHQLVHIFMKLAGVL
jgi:hypothetical protein